MSQSKLFIHIGTWKTGSSTIQYNLHRLKNDLETEGFYYLCKENKMVINDGAIRNFTEIEEDYIRQSREKFGKILEEKRKQGDPIFISSAEEFSGNPFDGFKNVRAVAQNLFEVTKDFELDIYIIVYLRRQDDFFESLYQQSIRLGQSHSFHEFSEIYDASDFNWYELLQAYAGIFGKDKMIVRRYHRKFLPEENSLVQDFGQVIGSEVAANFESTQSRNKGFSRDTLEITRIMNKYFEGEERFQLRKIYDRVNAKLPFENYSFFTDSERALFLKKYEESNRVIAKEFFGENELFPEPDYKSTNVEYTGLTNEAIVANFSKALLLVKKESEREKEEIEKSLRNKFMWPRIRRMISDRLERFPELKKSLKKLLG